MTISYPSNLLHLLNIRHGTSHVGKTRFRWRSLTRSVYISAIISKLSQLCTWYLENINSLSRSFWLEHGWSGTHLNLVHHTQLPSLWGKKEIGAIVVHNRQAIEGALPASINAVLAKGKKTADCCPLWHKPGAGILIQSLKEQLSFRREHPGDVLDSQVSFFQCKVLPEMLQALKSWTLWQVLHD